MNTVLDAPDIVLKADILDIDLEERPPTILYNWILIEKPHPWAGRIFAEECENHPTKGNCKNLLTGTIVYFNGLVGVAKSKRTSYILRHRKEIK